MASVSNKVSIPPCRRGGAAGTRSACSGIAPSNSAEYFVKEQTHAGKTPQT